MKSWRWILTFVSGSLLIGVVSFGLYSHRGTPDSSSYQASILETINEPDVAPSPDSSEPEPTSIQPEPTPPPVPVPASILPPAPATSFVAPAPVEVQPVSPAPAYITVPGGGAASQPSPPPVPASIVAVAPQKIEIVVESAQVEFICTPESHLVINELFIDMVGADNQEFIELYNQTDHAINLASSSIQYLSGSATSTTPVVKKNFIAGASIAASGFYLIGTGGYTGAVSADMTWSQALGNASGTIFLVANHDAVADFDDPDIVDKVTYGTADVPLPPVGQSVGRTSSGWIAFPIPTPRSANQ